MAWLIIGAVANVVHRVKNAFLSVLGYKVALVESNNSNACGEGGWRPPWAVEKAKIDGQTRSTEVNDVGNKEQPLLGEAAQLA